MGELPNLRALRDWANGKFASYDSTSLPNGIKFGVSDGAYGYYDSSNVFQPFSSGGATPPEFIGLDFPFYTSCIAYGGTYVDQSYFIPDEYITGKFYNRLKVQACFKGNFANTQTKYFKIGICISFYKEPVLTSQYEGTVACLKYTLGSDGTWTKAVTTLSFTSTYRTGPYTVGNDSFYKMAYISTTPSNYSITNWTVTSSGTYNYTFTPVWGDITAIYEDALELGYDVYSNIGGFTDTPVLYNGYYYLFSLYSPYSPQASLPIGIPINNSVNVYVQIYQNANSSSASSRDLYISPVTSMSSASNYLQAFKLKAQDNLNGEYNIMLYNA